MKVINAYNLNNVDPVAPNAIKIAHYADTCPICKKGQEPRYITAYIVPSGNLEVVFKCVLQRCGKLFISRYYKSSNYYSFQSSLPNGFIRNETSEEIKSISEKYEEIFNQALQCEQLGLYEIAGMGYRKALEFVIKDYLITFKKLDAAEISKQLLGATIKNIENKDIKELAEKTAWLGNDEAHYERRHAEMDINDLKALLSMTVDWITYEIKRKNLLEKF